MIVFGPREIKDGRTDVGARVRRPRSATSSRWRRPRPFATRAPVKVLLTPQGREVIVERAKRVSDLLEQLQVTPGTVLVIRGDHLLTDDARLSVSDEIELRSVVSGG